MRRLDTFSLKDTRVPIHVMILLSFKAVADMRVINYVQGQNFRKWSHRKIDVLRDMLNWECQSIGAFIHPFH